MRKFMVLLRKAIVFALCGTVTATATGAFIAAEDTWNAKGWG